jgi:hypothetical protein
MWSWFAREALSNFIIENHKKAYDLFNIINLTFHRTKYVFFSLKVLPVRGLIENILIA